MDHRESLYISLRHHLFRKLLKSIQTRTRPCLVTRKAASWQHRNKVTWSNVDRIMSAGPEHQWLHLMRGKMTSLDWVWQVVWTSIIQAYQNRRWRRHETTLAWSLKTLRPVKDIIVCSNSKCRRCLIMLVHLWLLRQRRVVTPKFKLITPSLSTMCTSRSSLNGPVLTSRRSSSHLRRATCVIRRRCYKRLEARRATRSAHRKSLETMQRQEIAMQTLLTIRTLCIMEMMTIDHLVCRQLT